MRNNTRKRPEEPATPEPRELTPRPTDSVLPSENGEEADAAPPTPKPPLKKRKIDTSPPWKSAATQTPTSFVIDGRRKSGRTNPVPFELLTPTAKGSNGTTTRQTRSSISKTSKTAAVKTIPRTVSAPSSTRRNVSHKLPDRTSTAASNSKNSKSYSRRLVTPTPPKQSTSQSSSSRSGKPKSGPKPKASPQRTAVAYPGTRRASTRMSTRAATEASVGRANQGLSTRPRKVDHLLFDSDGEADVGPDWKPPKIRIRFRRTPPLTITHPLHVPPKPNYESFEAFLDSEEVLQNKKDEEELEGEAREEAEIRQRVEDACKDGLLVPERCSAFMPEEQPCPPRQYYYHDQLLAHALNFQKLMERERRSHMAMARKLAVACAQKVQESIPKTKEEIEEELARETHKLYREAVVVGIRNKWALITEEVHRRRRERAEELRQLQGKEQLNQMLEHSTQLLKVRVRHASVLTASEAGDEEEGSEQDDDKDSEEEDVEEEGEEERGEEGEEEEEEEDEVNMSSGGTDDEEDDFVDDDDANLTIEQLREKYGNLARTIKPSNASHISSSPMQLSDVEDKVEEPNGTEAYENTAEITSPVEMEEVDDMLLDDDDESVAMDSEFDSAESDDEDSGEESETPGLLGFFGDIESLVKQASAPLEDTEDVKMGDAEQPLNHIEAQVNGNSEELDSGSQAVNEEGVSNVQIADPEEPTHDGDDSKALTPYAASQNGHMDIDDDTTVSNSPAQNKPSGSTTSHTTPQPTLDIKTPIPFLLRGTLREYQHYGLDWLAGLYDNKTNGILADEMGLGKTIQTIALIAHLACEKKIWGPHLIVVPTSVMLNWEMEFKKWAPGFKILTYYGSREQRAEKRKGWFDDNLWHVCITSYQLVLQDQVTFKRRNWHYLILDEAHNIKNFRSQRWQTLLNFKAEARLLITGTPLQNNLIELWSLLYFLMPSGASSSMPTGFANLKEFQEWFAHPVDQMIEGGREQMDDEARSTVTKLHRVLRPYLLRRLKADVEKQMPAKYEHVVYCRLSKRQRFLYDDFMSLAKTRETLASGNYLSIINCLMQLRKVCNHPDLFETRQIVTSFTMSRSAVADYEIKELLVRRRLMHQSALDTVDLGLLNLTPAAHASRLSTHTASSLRRLNDSRSLQRLYGEESALINKNMVPDFTDVRKNLAFKENVKKLSLLDQLKHCIYLNELRCNAQPIYGSSLLAACTDGVDIGPIRARPLRRAEITQHFLSESSIIRSMIPTLEERTEQMEALVDKFACVTPNVVCTDLPPIALSPKGVEVVARAREILPSDPFHKARVRLSIAFPDKRLLQYDCGKLQRLDILLRELQAGGHRALIFTQMTKVLDILEQFLNIHGHRYLRLDGSTKVEQRQILTERFNNDPRILVFILSTRSGGLGINLTGADTVIFYDLDWNPAMDKQCQDRCHRIGQTRDVHIYRFVSEYTIESNILRKANQKRMLDDVVIQEGDFTTDYFNKLTLKDMLGEDIVKELVPDAADEELVIGGTKEGEKALELAEDVEDVVAAKAAQRELVDVDGADFEDTSRPSMNNKLGDSATKEGSTPRVGATATTTAATTPKDVVMTDAGGEEGDQGEQEDDRDPGHIDEWMIKYIDWEIENLPVLPASKDSKKRRRERSKKGKLYK